MEGQNTSFNIQSKVLITDLRETFARAGIIFNWGSNYSQDAFGINKTIIQFVIGTEAKLLIHYHTGLTKKEYWINYDTLRDFITSNNNLFRVGNDKLIHNIPLSLFKPKPSFSGDIS